MDSQSLCLGLMQSPAAQGGGQLYDLEQSSLGAQQHDSVESSAAQDGGRQHHPMESSAAQHADQLHGLEQSSASEDGGEQHDPMESSSAQNRHQQHGLEHSVAAQDGSQLHDLAQSPLPMEADQQQDPVESPAAQNEGQQHDPKQVLEVEDEAQQHGLVQCSAAQDGCQQHHLEHCPATCHGDQQQYQEQRSAAQHECQLSPLEPSSVPQDEGQRDAEHNAAGDASRPRGVADIIRRFDSGSVWGSPQRGAHVKRPSPGSPEHAQHGAHAKLPSVESIEYAQHSHRISALTSKGQREGEHSSSPTESDLPLKDQGDESPVSHVNPAGSLLPEGSSDQPQLEGLLRHASLTMDATLQLQSTGHGRLALPQLQGQGSSMRGDLWLPQLWLEPAEDMQESTSCRNKIQKAMEAVRAAERAVEAASVFVPVRLGTSP